MSKHWCRLQHRATSIITWTVTGHQPLIKQWCCSLSCGDNDRKGPDVCIVGRPLTHPGHPENLSLSLASCSQSVWYYSQLNEGFIEATWIKRATATMYLLLCNAVNRFAEWGSNVFLYTNRSWNDALGGWASSEATAGTLWCVMETLSSSTGGLHVDSADTDAELALH